MRHFSLPKSAVYRRLIELDVSHLKLNNGLQMYKRNQIEEAISRAFGESSSKPSSELRTRIKRLLDLDRTRGRKVRSSDPEEGQYAFYSDSSPGKGGDIWFSEYEAFAVSLGLRLLEHGWPQAFAVGLLRRLRQPLESQHTRFMKQDPKALFDQAEIRRNIRPGDLGFDNTDPVMLTIVSGPEKDTHVSCVCRGMTEVAKFVRSQQARSWSLHELVTPAHSLSMHLKKVPVRKRGRSH